MHLLLRAHVLRSAVAQLLLHAVRLVCYGPRCSIADYVLGAVSRTRLCRSSSGSYNDPAYTVPKWIVVWGKEPLPSNGDGFFGHCLVDLMKLGTKIISIDPASRGSARTTVTSTCRFARRPTPPLRSAS